MAESRWAQWRADLRALGGYENELLSVPAAAVRQMIELGEAQAAEVVTVRTRNANLRAAIEAAPPIDGTATAFDYITWYNTVRRSVLDGN